MSLDGSHISIANTSIMSAAMLRQMMEEASVFMKEEKYQQALDSARRVSQFDAGNFQALMCVGLASFHLKKWEDSEMALQRAADLKPDLPGPWKSLVDLFDAIGDFSKRIDVVEKLIGVFRKGNKIKPSQKWTAELAANAMVLKRYSKAFDAWYALVGESQELCVTATPNDELPPPLEIWFQLIDLLQSPQFNLSDATASPPMPVLMKEFVAVAQRWNWSDRSPDADSHRAKTDGALAMFLRFQLNIVKSTKSPTTKLNELKTLDTLTASIIEWFPSARLPAEYLLLRSEDQDSPLTAEQVDALAKHFTEAYAKSAISLMFQGFAVLSTNPNAARELLVEGLASSSSSSFHESALCVRAQMELAAMALDTRDVEGCLSRLQRARELTQDKATVLGCQPPKPSIYSDIKTQLLLARAHDLAGAVEFALTAYRNVIDTSDADSDAVVTAAVGAAELLISKTRADEAIALLSTVDTNSLKAHQLAPLVCTRAWIEFQRGNVGVAATDLSAHAPHVPNTSDRARALKRLGIVHWHVDGGSLRSDKAKCLNNFLLAARLAPRDGEVFSWLGRWYSEVAADTVRGEKCFLKALELAPQNEMAGLALTTLYEQQAKPELNVALWERLTATPEKAPTWALLRLAQHLVDQDDEAAVTKLHVVLRNEPLNPVYWLAMGHVYRHFGKLVAAQRSYLRAMELGEAGWCVLTELARIEGSLRLFDDALARIATALDVVEEGNQAAKVVVETLFAELLFEHAKYLNGEGLYGRAAANLKKATTLLQSVLVACAADARVHTLKLLGDLHSFAFYLSPLNFTDDGGVDGSGWISFLSQGRAAYNQIISLTDSVDAAAMAMAHYDVGVSCWYIARALYATRGARFNAFATLPVSIEAHTDAQKSLEGARHHLRSAVQCDASCGLAWNALGVVLDHPLAKQLAWVRAIQTAKIDAAWANLGMLYVQYHHTHPGDGGRSAALARNALLHLQAVNPNNPAMWIGYGMLSLGQDSDSERHKALESFQCALEVGYHVDALLGFVASSLLVQQLDQKAEQPSSEAVLFAVKKYLEREPFDGAAWSLLSVVQLRLGLVNNAVASAGKSVGYSSHDDVVANQSIIHAVTTKGGGDVDQLLSSLAAKSHVAYEIARAQQLFHSGEVATSVQVTHALLADDAVSTNERGLVARFALALSALGVSTCSVPAKALAEAARAAVEARVASGEATSEDLQALEQFHRLEGSAVYDYATISARLALALVDMVDTRGFQSTRTDRVDTSDALTLSALQSLLTSQDGSVASTLKLVRAEPRNSFAYVVAALAVYKQSIFSQSTSSLASAQRLLSTGVTLASRPLSRLLVHWASSLVLQRSGEDNAKIASHAAAALVALGELDATVLAQHDRLLWEARVLSVTDHAAATAKYIEALAVIKASDGVAVHRVLAALHEIGSALEAFGKLDAAQQVWKTIMLCKPATEATETAAGLNTTAFVGNLRLALLHATRNNGKAAKKHAKTAVTLATRGAGDSGDPVDTSILTTARFVEGVVAELGA